MRRIKNSRPSPAIVVAVMALVAALAGTAVAADPVANTAVSKKQTKKIATKQADKQIDAREAGLSVANADTATNAEQLGGLPAGDYELGLRHAVVSANAGGATVVRGNATGAGRINTGRYTVSFEADIRPCTYVATDGDTTAGAGPAGEIAVEERAADNATDVQVRHYDSAGTQTDYAAGDGFHIAVVC